jgi:hypothetical protein
MFQNPVQKMLSTLIGGSLWTNLRNPKHHNSINNCWHRIATANRWKIAEKTLRLHRTAGNAPVHLTCCHPQIIGPPETTRLVWKSPDRKSLTPTRPNHRKLLNKTNGTHQTTENRSTWDIFPISRCSSS